MLKVALISLGCPKNRVDSENMLGFLTGKHEITEDLSEAQAIIINTCAFIQDAKEESINTILESLAFKRQNCRTLIVAGCLAERYAKELASEIPEVDAFVGVNDWEDILLILETTAEKIAFQPAGIYKNDSQLALCNAGTPRQLTTPVHYAYVKIAEGCDNCCSYCVIPSIRGAYRSRSMEDIVQEVESLTSQGVKEIILIAQDTTYYGKDLYGKLMLSELLERLNAIQNVRWIRLMYLYPQSFTDELLATIACLPKVLKYVDLPLQHIADGVLANMNRQDRKAGINKLITKLRKAIPDVCIRTTFIVGFPGETEEDFQELCEFIQDIRFDRLGVFAYSQEEDTVAGAMDEQVEEEIKVIRKDKIMAIQAKISENINCSWEGRILEIVLEGSLEDGLVVGRSYREAPEEIDGCIYVENVVDYVPGKFVRGEITQGLTYELLAYATEEVPF